MSFTYSGIDHILLAAPPDCEAAARRFYGDILGWTELPKPEPLRRRGGVWFKCGEHEVHIGVQRDFVPATKAHPAFTVHNLDALRAHLLGKGIDVLEDEDRAEERVNRFFVHDPFGNRLEFMERV